MSTCRLHSGPKSYHALQLFNMSEETFCILGEDYDGSSYATVGQDRARCLLDAAQFILNEGMLLTGLDVHDVIDGLVVREPQEIYSSPMEERLKAVKMPAQNMVRLCLGP